MRLTVRIPPNTQADVELPAATTHGITLDGAPLRQTSRSGNRIAVRLGAGDYTFDLPAPGS
jgi:hypothetical protein